MWKGNVVRIYTGPDNRSHFEDLSLPFDAIMMEGHAQHRSPTMPVKGLLFRENQLGPQGEYHTPKQRQFVITISGAVEISQTHQGRSQSFQCCERLTSASRSWSAITARTAGPASQRDSISSWRRGSTATMRLWACGRT